MHCLVTFVRAKNGYQQQKARFVYTRSDEFIDMAMEHFLLSLEKAELYELKLVPKTQILASSLTASRDTDSKDSFIVSNIDDGLKEQLKSKYVQPLFDSAQMKMTRNRGIILAALHLDILHCFGIRCIIRL